MADPAPDKVAPLVPPVSKAINRPFQVQQKYNAQQALKKAAAAKEAAAGGAKKAASKQGRSVGANILLFTIVSVLTSVFLSRTVTETWLWGYEGKYANPVKVRLSLGPRVSWAQLMTGTTQVYRELFPPKERFFTEADLAKYDGTNPAKPVYIAIDVRL